MVYPVLKSACEFYQDFLVEEPTHKWLVVSPSVSPENTPLGHRSTLVAGCIIDNQILFDLFAKTIKPTKLLKKDEIEMVDFKKNIGTPSSNANRTLRAIAGMD